ncbi:hypothetical protein ACERII_01460 [Evansella sp. AB-rgal1]|uniref:hypothetical protein n=1 Tax=Evansella sp. AB-rgal1 TaxID=3242696 RepID=UPI00359EE17B
MKHISTKNFRWNERKPTELQWEAEQRQDTGADEELPTGKGVGSSEWNNYR